MVVKRAAHSNVNIVREFKIRVCVSCGLALPMMCAETIILGIQPRNKPL